MPFSLIFQEVWRWIAGTGINLALLIVVAMLVPRAGRLAHRYVKRQVAESKDADEGKSSLALAGVGIYIVQIVAYFLILVFFLQQLGFSLAGAAIPATVISAAVGFGAQQIIADFVAGFFILTEKQYGVGDLVTFQGSGLDVTGDVIQITMRATQVRTLEQYTVTIPNSTAKVCINNSNHWSRALVVIPVPLLGSRDVEEVIARAESAARRAIADPEITPLIRGELISQPGIELNPPSTVGMPWTLDIRFMVRCSPGDQFPIERALRIYVLEEFFDEYGSATTAGGGVVDSLDDARTAAFAPAYASKRYGSDWAHRGAESFKDQPHADNADDDAAYGDAATIEPDAADRATDDSLDAVDVHDGDENKDTTPAELDPATEKRPKFGTMGGRVRASTGGLIGLFFALLILRGLTLSASDDSDASSGVLAPRPVSPTTTAPETSGTPAYTQPSPAETTTPRDESPRQNTPAPQTPEQATTPQTPGPTEPTQQPNQDQPSQNEPNQQGQRQGGQQSQSAPTQVAAAAVPEGESDGVS